MHSRFGKPTDCTRKIVAEAGFRNRTSHLPNRMQMGTTKTLAKISTFQLSRNIYRIRTAAIQ